MSSKWIWGGVALGVGILLFSKSEVVVGTRRVFKRERASGVDQRLQGFLNWWAVNGPFPIMIPPEGAIRTNAAEQLRFYNEGTSDAKTLADTPHGRGGALDLYPVVRSIGDKVLEIDAADRAKFKIIGEAAELFGLQWGGRFPKYDGPHVQVPGWRNLPYPPGGLLVA